MIDFTHAKRIVRLYVDPNLGLILVTKQGEVYVQRIEAGSSPCLIRWDKLKVKIKLKK